MLVERWAPAPVAVGATFGVEFWVDSQTVASLESPNTTELAATGLTGPVEGFQVLSAGSARIEAHYAGGELLDYVSLTTADADQLHLYECDRAWNGIIRNGLWFDPLDCWHGATPAVLDAGLRSGVRSR